MLKQRTTIVIAILLGLLIAFIDTRPHWDDTGVTVLLILIASFVCGFLSSKRPWLMAIAVGLWIPVFNIIFSGNFGSLIALIPAFVGAFAGNLLKRMFPPPTL
jgi:hypothetical protein